LKVFRFAVFALLLAIAAGARAQTITTVTGTVIDATGIPFANSPVNITLLGGPPTPIVTATNSPVEMPIAPTTNAGGAFSVNLVATASISPATTYSFRVCSPPVAPPVGIGAGVCVNITGVTIAGSSQDLSALFAAAPPPSLVNLTNPSRVFNLIPTASLGSLVLTPMTTAPAQPATGSSYVFSGYLTQVALGTGCTGNTTVTLQVTFQDPNAAAPQLTPIGSFTVTTNGTVGIVPLTSGAYGGQIALIAKPGTVVQYSTLYALGTGCTIGPSVQLFPVLELR
jgi:hypothetical protein